MANYLKNMINLIINIKKHLFVFTIALFFVCSSSISQNASTKYYYCNVNKNVAKTKSFKHDIKQSLYIKIKEKKSSEDIKASSAIVSFVVGTLMPYVINKVPRLFYNPKKYMKDYGTDLSLLTNKDSIIPFNSITSIIYEKKSDSTLLTQLQFTVTDYSSNPNFRRIELTKGIFNYTPVKLKGSFFKTNAVISIVLNYYDEKSKKSEIRLEPIKLEGIIPGKSYELKKIVQLIPKVHLMESIQIEISEVNNRKKDWDKWLELYNDNQDKLKDYLLGLIEK
tara:strand:- start:1771 stop:2610 length:840 start_codon:yes stop_codon:yes gene_type:complete